MARAKKKNTTEKKRINTVQKMQKDNTKPASTVKREAKEAKKAPSNRAVNSGKNLSKKGKTSESKVGVLQKVRQFLREVKVELKKVTWPTRKETIASTMVVVILVLIVSLYLGLIDIGLTKFITILIR